MNRRLYRCRENRVLAGVAGGVAEFLGLDPTLVRVLWFVSVFFGGISIVLYVGLALIMPLEPAAVAFTGDGTTADPAADAPVAPGGHQHLARPSGRVTMFIGIVLILVGALALIDIALPGWASWRQLWPLLLISIGGLLMVGALRRRPNAL